MQTIREIVTSDEYRHVPTGTRAILAQRLSKVFASPTTWYKLIHQSGWRRPRLRVHRAKPRVGSRASRPNEIRHVDTTVIRLLDGTRAYLYGIIDNFSRRILAWRLSQRFDISNTIAILPEAPPTVIADSGVENVNRGVDELVDLGRLRRVLAMTEIHFSNSMIEAWWRVLKHNGLYLHNLDTVAKRRHLVEYDVGKHNSELPHSAFKGQTPDEIYFGTGAQVPKELEAAREAARLSRLETNRALECGACPRRKQASEEQDSEAA